MVAVLPFDGLQLSTQNVEVSIKQGLLAMRTPLVSRPILSAAIGDDEAWKLCADDLDANVGTGHCVASGMK
jgi:hypothetical protein